MPDRRRFRGRSSVNLGGIASIFGDGGISAVNPGDVPFEDASFDANTMTRFAPNSGFLNTISGGRASGMANQLNAKQILDAQQAQNELAMQPKFDALELAKVKDLNNQTYNTNVNRIASVLANEDLDGLGYLNPDDLLPPEYLAEARSNMANYGRGLETEGLQGAPSVISARNAGTDYTKAQTNLLTDKSDFGVHRPDGSIFYPKANVIMKEVRIDPLDPTKGNKWIRTDLNTVGREEAPVGSVTPVSTPKPASEGIVSSIRNAITPEDDNTALIPGAINSTLSSPSLIKAGRNQEQYLDAMKDMFYDAPIQKLFKSKHRRPYLENYPDAYKR
jgi:hypothetical protein